MRSRSVPDAGLEVDDEVRLGEAVIEERINLMIERKLVLGQVDRGKNPVLVKDVVGDRSLLKQVRLQKSLLLPIARKEKKKSGFEKHSLRATRKLLEERVFLDVFQDELGLELLGQQPGQRGLPDPDGTSNGDETAFHHTSR